MLAAGFRRWKGHKVPLGRGGRRLLRQNLLGQVHYAADGDPPGGLLVAGVLQGIHDPAGVSPHLLHLLSESIQTLFVLKVFCQRGFKDF